MEQLQSRLVARVHHFHWDGEFTGRGYSLLVDGHDVGPRVAGRLGKPVECLFVQNQEFKAYLWEAYMPSATYAEWLLQTDMTTAYTNERMVLQMLQSRAPGAWSLKMPSHAVHINARLATFPDARIVWGHRDPFKATASFLRLNYLSPAVLGAGVDVDVIVPNVLRQLHEHINRPSATRRRIGDDRFFDLH